MTYSTTEITEQSLKLTNGNAKIPRTTAIFSMGSSTNCPSKKLGLCDLGCSGRCYAMKAERLYPNVIKKRNYTEELWLSISADTFAKWFLFQSTRRTSALRLNESGDFHSQECVDKAEKVAKILKEHGITTYLYTHRIDLDFSNIKDLVVNISADSKNIDVVKEKFLGKFNVFYCSQKQNKELESDFQCPSDCNICSLCATNHKKVTHVDMH